MLRLLTLTWLFFEGSGDNRDLHRLTHSCPTRRSPCRQREGDSRRSKDTLDQDRTGGIPANREKSEPFVRDDEQEQAEERADLEELQTGQTGDQIGRAHV